MLSPTVPSKHPPRAVPPRTLTERSLSAVKWNYFGVVARIASQLVVQITLARLLGPEAMGLFAIVLLIVTVSGILAELGLGPALVQKAQISDDDVRLVFTRTLLAGVGIALIVVVAAPWVSEFFADARTTDILRAMAPVIVLQSLAVTPLALLKRDLDFKSIQIAQLLSYLVGFLGVGVGAALLGAGVWSLVAAWTCQAAVAAGSLYFLRRHRVRPLFSHGDVVLRGFALRVQFTNVANWIIENLDNLLIGKLFGAAGLGLYAVSYNLVRTPANHLVTSVQAVLFPASSRAQDNPDGVRRAYLAVIAGISLAAFPVFLGIAVVADTVVAALFGGRWAAASPLLAPLAAAMALHALMAVAGPVLWAKGFPGRELRMQAVVAICLVLVILVASRYSIVAVAWGVFLVYALRLFGMTLLVMGAIKLKAGDLFGALRGGLWLAAIVVSFLLVLDHSLADLVAPLRLALEIGCAAVLSLAFVLALPRVAISSELFVLANRILAKAPVLARSAVLRRVLDDGHRSSDREKKQ